MELTEEAAAVDLSWVVHCGAPVPFRGGLRPPKLGLCRARGFCAEPFSKDLGFAHIIPTKGLRRAVG